MARSLTVPLTASSPMFPPGKNNGVTTNESVVNAMRAETHPAGVIAMIFGLLIFSMVLR